MQHASPYDMAKDVERILMSVLSKIDLANLGPGPQGIVSTLKHQTADVRLYARDFELADTRTEQLGYAREGRRCLEDLRKNILAASQYGIFSAIDVAHISAHVDRLIGILV